jgi:putative sigma-54 modulation protein
MDSSDALRNYAEERLEKIKRYFSDPLKVSCTFSVEKIHHQAAFDVTLRNGLSLHSSESTENMYSSIDMALAKMERQVRRYKDRIKSHKPHKGKAARVRQAILSADAYAPIPDPAPADPTPAPAATAIAHVEVIREKEFRADRLDVDQAIMQMDLAQRAFLVFTNVDTGDINVVYRDEGGNYGLIETRGHVAEE